MYIPFNLSATSPAGLMTTFLLYLESSKHIPTWISSPWWIQQSTLYKYAMPVWVSWWNVSQREDSFPRGRSPRENHPHEGRHSIRIPTLAWHICFIIPNHPQFGKISMKTTMTAGRSSENGRRFAGGHFAGGHDGMANLCKPITAYDFHVRYNNIYSLS